MKACLYLAMSIQLLAAAGCGLEGPVPSEKSAPAAQQVAQADGTRTVPATLGNKPSAAVTASATGVTTTQATAPAKPSATGMAAAQPAASAATSATGVATARRTARSVPSGTGAAAATPPGMAREKAEVGMGLKGHDYGNGYFGVVLAAYWRSGERIYLQQIQHNMDLFKAEHDGKGPKTHEEFMQKIIKEGDIKLPELPPGHKYLYDPDKEDLMVLKPANEP